VLPRSKTPRSQLHAAPTAGLASRHSWRCTRDASSVSIWLYAAAAARAVSNSSCRHDVEGSASTAAEYVDTAAGAHLIGGRAGADSALSTRQGAVWPVSAPRRMAGR